MAGRRRRSGSVAVRVSTYGVLALIVIIAAIGGVFAAVSDAGGGSSSKSYTCTADSIEATLDADGSLSIVEARTYKFQGSYELSAICFDPPTEGGVSIQGVSVIDADGEQSELSETEFQEQWRYEGGPGDGCWAYDSEELVLYAFSDTEDETKTFVFSYTYKQAALCYADVAELYWQFIPAGWETDSKNVTLTVTLPVAEGDAVEGGENVRAFGHGSSGSVSFADDGSIVFTASKVASGEFAEARITFPTSWLSEDVAVNDYDVLDSILEEEEQWAAETRVQNIFALLWVLVPLLVSAALIVWCVVMFRRHGREHVPAFDGEYWRDVPEKGLHPVLVGRLWRWDEEDADDLTATLMYLSAKGVIGIERAVETKKRVLFGDKEQETYRLYRRNDAALAGMSEMDRRAHSFVFDTIGAGARTVTLSEIERYGERHPDDFIAKMEAFQMAASAEVEKRGFFEKPGEKYKSVFRIVSLVLLVVALVVCLLVSNFITLLCLAPGIAFMFGISFAMPRRSVEAVEVQAKSKALKRWFDDFTALDEAVPTDTKVWGELLVYAYIFGVAESVAERLNDVAPEVFEGPATTTWVLWYHGPSGHVAAHTAACSADFFGRCFSNTAHSAQAAIDAASRAASNAGRPGSGGGFSGGGGGGFSVGGGGGFGGGGGGFSR